MEIEIWHIWLLAAILLFIVEIFMSSFIAVCFGIGALATGIATYVGLSLHLQVLLFVGFSFLGFFLVRPCLKRFIFQNAGYIKNDNLLVKEAGINKE